MWKRCGQQEAHMQAQEPARGCALRGVDSRCEAPFACTSHSTFCGGQGAVRVDAPPSSVATWRGYECEVGRVVEYEGMHLLRACGRGSRGERARQAGGHGALWRAGRSGVCSRQQAGRDVAEGAVDGEQGRCHLDATHDSRRVAASRMQRRVRLQNVVQSGY